jgi:GMP synthase (glutamine-hydrolysing)
VLHWHGDVFSLPAGATLLASSAQTAVQGFRVHNARGFLFHAEADLDLTRAWLAEPSMRDEAVHAFGPDGPARILGDAELADDQIRRQTQPLFAEFAAVARGD